MLPTHLNIFREHLQAIAQPSPVQKALLAELTALDGSDQSEPLYEAMREAIGKSSFQIWGGPPGQCTLCGR